MSFCREPSIKRERLVCFREETEALPPSGFCPRKKTKKQNAAVRFIKCGIERVKSYNA